MKELMVKYKVLIGTYLKVYKKYPMGLFLKLIYVPVQMLMYVFLWVNIAKSSNIDLSYMVCYYLFTILLGYAFPFVHIASDIQKDVMEGRLANCLVRPVHYVTPILARYIAWMLCYFVIFIPAILFACVFRRIPLINIIFFITYLLAGVFVEFLIWYNVGLVSMKIETIRGLTTAIMAVKLLTSGALIPLSFFPEMIKGLLAVLPFRFYIFLPVNSLLYGEEPAALLVNLGLAAVWIVILILLGEVQWRSGLKKLQLNIS